MRKFLKVLVDVFEKHLSSIMLFILFASMFIQVILRYFFNMPSPELFEISTYSFVWTVLLGAAFASRYRDHIRFNIIYEKFPRKVQLIVDIFFDTFFNLLLLISLYPVLRQSFWYKIIRSEVLNIPWTYLVICLPIAMVLIIVHNSIFIYKAIIELIKRKHVDVEEKPWQ